MAAEWGETWGSVPSCKHLGTYRSILHPPRLQTPVHGWEVLVEAAAREKLWHSAITVILINSLQMVDLEFHIVLFWFA